MQICTSRVVWGTVRSQDRDIKVWRCASNYATPMEPGGIEKGQGNGQELRGPFKGTTSSGLASVQ